MEVLQADTITYDTIPDTGVSLGENADQYVRGRFLRFQVGVVFILYSLIAFAFEIKGGFYIFKIGLLLSTSLLLFSPPSYPYLMGLLISVYFPLKATKYAWPETHYIFQYAPVMIILMTIYHWAWKQFGGHRRNPYQHFDLGSLCLLGIIGFAVLGGIVATNRFLYANRLVGIIAFGCAFYLGRSLLNIQQSLRPLLMGLLLGIMAFELPVSVGHVLRYGPGILGSLGFLRAELGIGAGGLGSSSGNLLAIFALAYSLSSSGLPPKIKRLALWFVSVPAGIIVLLYMSKGAIILLPFVVFFNLIFSGRRRAAIFVALVTIAVGVLVYTRLPDLIYSIGQRFEDIAEVAADRLYLRIQAIKNGFSHPLLGVGAGQYKLLTSPPHNDELNILVEHGVIPFLLYILFWSYATYMALKLRLSKDYLVRSLGGAFLVFVATYIGYTQIQELYYNRGGFLFAFSVGILATLYYRSKDEYSIYENV